MFDPVFVRLFVRWQFQIKANDRNFMKKRCFFGDKEVTIKFWNLSGSGNLKEFFYHCAIWGNSAYFAGNSRNHCQQILMNFLRGMMSR